MVSLEMKTDGKRIVFLKANGKVLRLRNGLTVEDLPDFIEYLEKLDKHVFLFPEDVIKSKNQKKDERAPVFVKKALDPKKVLTIWDKKKIYKDVLEEITIFCSTTWKQKKQISANLRETFIVTESKSKELMRTHVNFLHFNKFVDTDRRAIITLKLWEDGGE